MLRIFLRQIFHIRCNGAEKTLSEKKFSGRCSKSAIRTFYEMNLTFKIEMNRILATTLLAALAFTGCMKDNSEEYKKQQQVIPGVDIYSSAMVQQNVSTQMAEAGLRLASLLAEAKVQYPDTPLEEVDLSKIEVKVWDDTRPLQLLLFGSGTQIAREGADSWRITYPDGLLQTDGFMLEGSLVVNTNGTELLSDATFSTPWQVVMQPDFKIKANTTDGLGNSRQVSIAMQSGTTKLYLDETDNYVVILDMIRANFEESEQYVSGWNGQINIKPESGKNLAFSEIYDKDIHVESTNIPMAPYGAGCWGSTFYANSSSTGSMGMSYKLQNGVYRCRSIVVSSGVGVYMQIVEGSQICSFTSVGDYNTALYPSGEVEYKWSNTDGKLSYTIYYNGYTYTV